MKIKASEHHEQSALFRWASYIPELRYMFAVPNAAKRSPKLCMMMKAEGLKSGVPDIFLPLAKKNYHGLFIEMKSQKGKVSDAQNEYMDYLRSNGYHCAICYGFEEAKKAILEYLK